MTEIIKQEPSEPKREKEPVHWQKVSMEEAMGRFIPDHDQSFLSNQDKKDLFEAKPNYYGVSYQEISGNPEVFAGRVCFYVDAQDYLKYIKEASENPGAFYEKYNPFFNKKLTNAIDSERKILDLMQCFFGFSDNAFIKLQHSMSNKRKFAEHLISNVLDSTYYTKNEQLEEISAKNFDYKTVQSIHTYFYSKEHFFQMNFSERAANDTHTRIMMAGNYLPTGDQTDSVKFEEIQRIFNTLQEDSIVEKAMLIGGTNSSIQILLKGELPQLPQINAY